MLSHFLHSDPERSWFERKLRCQLGSATPEAARGDDVRRETQRELVAHAERIAVRVGAAPGKRIVVSCRHAESFVPGLFGSWLAGATVELLPNVQPATLDRVDADVGIAAVLHDDPERVGRSVKAHYVPAILTGHSFAPAARMAWPTVAVRMTTSGTTGQPKYVDKSMLQLANELAVLARTVPGAACVGSTVPLSHLYGLLWGALLPLKMGARIASHAALLPGDVRAVIERDGVDLLISTPAHLRAMAAVAMPRELRVISSGASLPAALHTTLMQVHAWQVTDVFGSTETGGIAQRSHPDRAWTPLSSVVVRAVDQRIGVESPWCPPTVLDEHIALQTDGTFRHLGRGQAMIKIAGKRANAQAIEAAALGVAGVADAALFVHETEDREPRIAMAIVAASEAHPVGREALAAAIADQFDAVFVPRIVKVVASIPRTERGKVDRSAMRELLIGNSGPNGAPTPNRIAVRRVAPGHYAANVPPDLVFFRGHFEAAAVLPGATLVERVMWPVVRSEWPDITVLRGIRRLRFRRPVFPGEHLSVAVERNAAKVIVEVASASSPVASAQLLIE